jgi:hypothetical protein
MKFFSKFIAIFIATLATATMAMAQIPNAGFETWSNASGYNAPMEWDNLNTMTTTTGVYTCTKGTPGSVGTSYLKLVSKNVAGMGVMPGMAVSGMIDMATLQPMSGFAYTQRPTALTGKWQHMASGADEGHIVIEFTRWNAAMGMRMPVGSAMRMLGGMAMSWADFTIPIVYTSTEMPDSCTITLSASGTTPVAGSYLYVDALAFTGVTVATEKLTAMGDFKVFPNPAMTYISIDKTAIQGSITELSIIDLQGKTIETLDANTVNWDNVDVVSLPKGNYFIKITTEKGVITQQFSKQ